MGEVGTVVARVGAEKVVPIHPEHPEMFSEFKRKKDWKLVVPALGKPDGLGGNNG